MATYPFCAPGLVGSLWTNRLVESSRGRQLRASCFWGTRTGPNPTDRAKLGSKRHLICDGQGFHSRSSSPVPIATTRNKHSHSSKPSHPYRESKDARAIVLIAS